MSFLKRPEFYGLRAWRYHVICYLLLNSYDIKKNLSLWTVGSPSLTFMTWWRISKSMALSYEIWCVQFKLWSREKLISFSLFSKHNLGHTGTSWSCDLGVSWYRGILTCAWPCSDLARHFLHVWWLCIMGVSGHVAAVMWRYDGYDGSSLLHSTLSPRHVGCPLSRAL